jgi:hypothetical protein
MQLDPIQLRVLGSLVEKEITTPENYPLSPPMLSSTRAISVPAAILSSISPKKRSVRLSTPLKI